MHLQFVIPGYVVIERNVTENARCWMKINDQFTKMQKSRNAEKKEYRTEQVFNQYT